MRVSENFKFSRSIHGFNVSSFACLFLFFLARDYRDYLKIVLLSKTCFLLLLSGSYGYDRNCWFQAKMIINIRNELLSSCLGSLQQKLNW